MPQKINRAGKMQNYVPAGHGDESGEYRGGEGGGMSSATTQARPQGKYFRAKRIDQYKKEEKNNPLNITDEEMQKRAEPDPFDSKRKIVKGVDGSSAYFDHILQDEENPEIKASVEAQDQYNRIRERAPIITRDLRDAGLNLIMTEYNTKTGTSLFRKINKWRKEDPDYYGDKKDEEVMMDIGDIVRFTHEGEHQDLANVTQNLIDELNAHPDYDVVEVDNKYLGTGQTYKAIHLKVKDKQTGIKFEIQIHSPDSQKLKNITHKYYEESRKTGISPEEKDYWDQKSIDTWAELPDPVGIQNIKSFNKEE